MREEAEKWGEMGRHIYPLLVLVQVPVAVVGTDRYAGKIADLVTVR